MLFLKNFKDLISSDLGQVVVRQYFFVEFTCPSKSFPVDLGLYVQNFDLPNLALDDDGSTTIKNPRGTYQVPGDSLIIPEANSFTIDFLETEAPVIENIFVPWLEQVVNIRDYKATPMPDVYPFPKAKVSVHILSTEDPSQIVMTYEFYGVYPTQITLPTLGQAPKSDISRPITFAFNKTKIERKGKYSSNSSFDTGASNTSEIKTPKKQVANIEENKLKNLDIKNKSPLNLDGKVTINKLPLKKFVLPEITHSPSKKKFDLEKTISEVIGAAKDINTARKTPWDINNIKIAKRAKNETVDKIIDSVLKTAKNVNKVKKEISK
jgi:hypothetical protein